MEALTVNDLFKACQNAIDKGYGDRKVLISQDDEGNGFHELFYDFIEAEQFKSYSSVYFPVDKKELSNYLILG